MACDKGMRPSGIPIKCTACWAATATVKALGSARPISSEADITNLRAIKLGSSPALSIRASQYTDESGSEALIDFMNAEIVS